MYLVGKYSTHKTTSNKLTKEQSILFLLVTMHVKFFYIVSNLPSLLVQLAIT